MSQDSYCILITMHAHVVPTLIELQRVQCLFLLHFKHRSVPIFVVFLKSFAS